MVWYDGPMIIVPEMVTAAQAAASCEKLDRNGLRAFLQKLIQESVDEISQPIYFMSNFLKYVPQIFTLSSCDM